MPYAMVILLDVS